MTENELALVLEEGEGYKLEFKEALTNLDKEMVAFSNASGGRIFLGITDSQEIAGFKNSNKLKSQVQDIANNCQPSIAISIKEYKNILIVSVKEGEDKPYKCSSGFYIRVGPNSQKLSRNEIVEFFKSEGKIRYDELINPRFDFDTHFDPKKFDRFLRLAGISKVMDTEDILVNLGAAEKQEGKIIFNNTGIFFFSRNLQDLYFHTMVTCALYKGVEKVDVLDRRDFNDDIISSIDRVMNFLKQYIPVRYEIAGEPRRKEIPEVPYEALREAVINAVAHRDYFEKGSNVMVEMFDDRIEITNFGGLVKGLKKEDIGKKSVLRNPNIANFLHRIGYIEKMGTGINRMHRLIKKAGLPPIQFEFDNFFTVIFKRKPRAENGANNGADGAVNSGNVDINNSDGLEAALVNGTNNGAIKKAVLLRLKNIIFILSETEPTNISQLVLKSGISRRTLQRDLVHLKKKQLIAFEGVRKSGGYILTAKGKRTAMEMKK
jgi:ATP-dependent DNA helicase RecG